MGNKVLVVYSGRLGVGGANIFLRDLLKRLLQTAKVRFYTLSLRVEKGFLHISLGAVWCLHGELQEHVLHSCHARTSSNVLSEVIRPIRVFIKIVKPRVMVVNSVDPMVLNIVDGLLNIVPNCYLVVHDGGFFCPLKHMWDPLEGKPCNIYCLELGRVPEYCMAAAALLKIGYVQPTLNPLKTRYLRLTKSLIRGSGSFHELWKVSRRVIEQSVVITPSRFMMDLVKRFASANAIVIRHGAPGELFFLAKKRKKPSLIKIGFIGDVSLHKGVHVLLKAIDATFRRQSNIADKIAFYIIGPVHLFSSISMGIVRRYTRLISDRIKLLCPIRSRAKIYSLLDVVVLPSICCESAGLTVVEGVASGRYAIASRLGGVPAYLEGYPRGLLVEPGNAYELANAIIRVAEMVSSSDLARAIDTRRYISTLYNVALEYAHLVLKDC